MPPRSVAPGVFLFPASIPRHQSFSLLSGVTTA